MFILFTLDGFKLTLNDVLITSDWPMKASQQFTWLKDAARCSSGSTLSLTHFARSHVKGLNVVVAFVIIHVANEVEIFSVWLKDEKEMEKVLRLSKSMANIFVFIVSYSNSSRFVDELQTCRQTTHGSNSARKRCFNVESALVNKLFINHYEININ